jgi:hypothetical protein
MSVQPASAMLRRDLRTTQRDRHVLVLRLVAGVPLLGIGAMHVFVPETPMRRSVDRLAGC